MPWGIVAAASVMFTLASVNALQQGSGLLLLIRVTAAAIVAPTIAGASFMVVSAWQRRASVAFAAAYVVLPTGPVAYGRYVIRGTATSPTPLGTSA